MMPSNLNKKSLFILLLIFVFSNLKAEEEEVDIWKQTNKSTTIETEKKIQPSDGSSSLNKNELNFKKVSVQSSTIEEEKEIKLHGLFDPEQNSFELSMWESSAASDITEIIKRIEKINLSPFAEKMFIDIIFTYSYLPQNMDEEDFLKIKTNWLIKNEKDEVIEKFLNKNENFFNKKKVIQYLVDKNIASADIKKGCDKIQFINKEIKDSYLDKFRIYCLVYNKKSSQAQLLYDILKEEGRSDKFFDDKISYLFGFSEKTSKKINDSNLLNFYLSSVTIKDFKYQPTQKTKESIWQYLNSANLIDIENIEDNKKIEELEIAANRDSLKKAKIFEIYKRKNFDLNTLLNANELHKKLDPVDSRALIYQKFLLSDDVSNKLDLLFLLQDKFNQNNLKNVYSEFLSDRLKEFNTNDIPENYTELVKKSIIIENNNVKRKLKYDDKILHRSKVLKFYTEKNVPAKKAQKDLENIYKKIKRNKKYFFSAKDLVLVEALEKDGLKIPKELNHKDVAKKYSVPKNLENLIKNGEKGFLALKIVEIIGEDNISNLDPETIYFITHLLNKANLTILRNKVIVSALPLRT